ncbi:MAG TPA: helix-turn-helix transcriptional regulator [Conexibacter sp.]
MSHPSDILGSSLYGARSRDQLSARELEVLGLVARGERTRDIAPRLGITENTVKSHLTRAYRKIGARNRVEATRHYLAHHTPTSTPPRGQADPEAAPRLNEFLQRQLTEIGQRVEELNQAIAEATDERDRLEHARAALLEAAPAKRA